MPIVERSAQVTYSAEQMFDLVNDVESYPKFLHWCRGARVDSRDANTVEATVDIGLLPFQQSFRTRNILSRPERISINLISGPFRKLNGEWRFRSLPGGGSIVGLSLEFEVTASPLAFVFARVFEEVVNTQINAFVARAAQLYA